MINPIVNNREHRMRALLRIAFFIILAIPVLGLPALIPYSAAEFLLRALLVLGLYYVILRFVDLRSWEKESGLIPGKTWRNELIAGIGMGAAAMALIFLVEWLTGAVEISSFAWEHNSGRFWLIPLIIFLVEMIAVGVYEELILRGYILRNLSEGATIKNLSPQTATLIAVILSSVLFGVTHGGNPNVTWMAIVNICVAGLMLAVPFVLTGRLALSIGIHFSWNFFQGGIFGFRVSGVDMRNPLLHIRQYGNEIWTGGAFGPEGGLAGLIGILLILLMVIYYLKNKGHSLTLDSTFTKTYIEKSDHME